MRSTQTSSLFPKRGDHNAKRNEETQGQSAREDFKIWSARSINHKATQNKNNTGNNRLRMVSSINYRRDGGGGAGVGD